MLASLSEGTQKQYNCTYRKWWNFCRGKNIYNTDQNKIILFLKQEFDQGANYSTLNTHRSALSTLLEIKNQNHIERFMKGVFRKRPSFPRYNETWDPSPVLAYVESLQPLETISLEKVTTKLVLLLALTTAQRVQTLSKIKIKNINHLEDRIEIRITDFLKSSKPDQAQPLLVFHYFQQKELCVASVLNQYLKRTSLLRGRHNELLITVKKPYHPASSQTISNWIKKGLSASGIDTTKFKSHSTRHASTSEAFRRGVNIENIRRAAGWSNKSNTFNLFYNRPLLQQSKDFADGLLNAKNK